MAARRCSMGCASWPDQMLYSKCPICGEQTSRMSKQDPMDEDEARSLLLHYEFETYYARREALVRELIEDAFADTETADA